MCDDGGDYSGSSSSDVSEATESSESTASESTDADVNESTEFYESGDTSAAEDTQDTELYEPDSTPEIGQEQYPEVEKPTGPEVHTGSEKAAETEGADSSKGDEEQGAPLDAANEQESGDKAPDNENTEAPVKQENTDNAEDTKDADQTKDTDSATEEAAVREEIEAKSDYSPEVNEHISSVEELEIYQKAGLKETEINGRTCLIREDIDLDYVDPVTGDTNRELMEKGNAPYDSKTGEQIVLHHIGQDYDSPLAELTKRSEHQIETSKLHTKEEESWRKDEKKNNHYNNTQRPNHWKARVRGA